MCGTIYGHVRSTALQLQWTHARLFVAVAALARHAARCPPSIASLINLTLVQCVQVINKRRPRLNAGVHGGLKEINARAFIQGNTVYKS